MEVPDRQFFGEEEKQALQQRLAIEDGDLILLRPMPGWLLVKCSAVSASNAEPPAEGAFSLIRIVLTFFG